MKRSSAPEPKPKVRLIREALGLTQEQFGWLFNACGDSVYRWERGEPMSRQSRTLLIATCAQPEIIKRLRLTLSLAELVEALGIQGPGGRPASSPSPPPDPGSPVGEPPRS